MEIIYCDNHLLVVNKPAGLLTQPTDSDKDNLEDRAKQWVKEKFHKPGSVFLHCIHRLDRPVGGLVLFARTSKALSRLNEEARQKRFSRYYHARVWGHLPAKEGTLEHFLRHGSFRSYPSSQEEGKLSRLSYRVLSEDEETTLLEIRLETGRYHQIRAQLGAEGFPVVGDEKYGSPTASSTILLHHIRLEFFHPVTGEKMIFQVKEPF